MLLNQLLPNWAVTFLLIPLLCYLTLRMGKTAARLYQAESAAAAAGHLLPGQQAVHSPKSESCDCCGEASGGDGGAVTQQAQHQQQQRGCRVPWSKAAELLVLWAVLLCLQHAKAHSEGLQFAALYAAQAAAAIGASGFFIWQASGVLIWGRARMWCRRRSPARSLQTARCTLHCRAPHSTAGLCCTKSAPACLTCTFHPPVPLSWCPSPQAVYNRGGSVLGTLGSSWEEAPAPLPVAEAEGQAGALPCSTMDPADWGPECLAESAAIALGGGTAAGMLGIGGARRRSARWGLCCVRWKKCFAWGAHPSCLACTMHGPCTHGAAAAFHPPCRRHDRGAPHAG